MPRRELGLDERQGVEWCIRVQGVVVLSLLGLRPQKRADHRHRYLSTTTATETQSETESRRRRISRWVRWRIDGVGRQTNRLPLRERQDHFPRSAICEFF